MPLFCPRPPHSTLLHTKGGSVSPPTAGSTLAPLAMQQPPTPSHMKGGSQAGGLADLTSFGMPPPCLLYPDRLWPLPASCQPPRLFFFTSFSHAGWVSVQPPRTNPPCWPCPQSVACRHHCPPLVWHQSRHAAPHNVSSVIGGAGGLAALSLSCTGLAGIAAHPPFSPRP